MNGNDNELSDSPSTHKFDSEKVVFYSKNDLSSVYFLQKCELILNSDFNSNHFEINEILEIYNIKKYIDNELYLNNWTQEDIERYKLRANEYGRIIGRYISTIEDNNIILLYKNTLQNYISSFWELINTHNVYKRIFENTFCGILNNEPDLIHEILNHKKLVNNYDEAIKNFLIDYHQSAEILLTHYEEKNTLQRIKKYIPESLTINEKEDIILKYLESETPNLNYVRLIQNIRNKGNFKVSDKIRLKAKRLYINETEKILSQNSMKFGVSIVFRENASKVKEGYFDKDFIAHYFYSLDYIKTHQDFYSLFKNFKYLFEYIDTQNRINLVSKRSQLGFFERFMGVHSSNEYRIGAVFSLLEMTSQSQIYVYSKILNTLNIDLVDILIHIYKKDFNFRYNYPSNARFSIPSATSTYFEKIRILAPEFEYVLKQFKVFVEDGIIDYELLQISSAPSAIKDIPSLNQNKYIYFEESNKEMIRCSNLFFSDQTLLAYVDPFKEKKYQNLFEILINEKVLYDNYERHQKLELNYLMDKGFISVDSSGFIRIMNRYRLLILKDLFDNEVASFYRYSTDFQREALNMAAENIIFFENSLFSKPEISYLNYFLNKSEFTNGLDLRNSYLHGTQANPEEKDKHEYSYYTYLKLFFLIMLKIDDDLEISMNNDDV